MPAPYLTAFSQYPQVVARFFGRRGGVIPKNDQYHRFASLSCSYRDEFPHEWVTQNRELIAEECGMPQVLVAKQCHGNDAIVITPQNIDKYIECDAMITREPGVLLGVNAADCCPILLHDPVSGYVAAIHAGWRGAFAGVIESTVDKMISLGCKATDIMAEIGPTIHLESYKVDASFKERFMEKDPEYSIFFEDIDTIIHFNLIAFVMYLLESAGLNDIKLDNARDTFSNPEEYFSYRREFLALPPNHPREKRPEYGCQLSVIGVLDSRLCEENT